MQKKKLRNTLFKTNAELVAKIKQNRRRPLCIGF